MKKFWITMLSVILIVLCVITFLPLPSSERKQEVLNLTLRNNSSDWLIDLYAHDGSVIKHWELKDKIIKKDLNSGSISFTNNSLRMEKNNGTS